MKTFTLLLVLWISFPVASVAQTAGNVLDKVATAISAGQLDQATGLFRQAVQMNAEKSEMFYWTDVDKSSEVCLKLAQELADYYKKKRNYDKGYLFYKELLQRKPDNVDCLTACAEMEVGRGRETEALRTYERVIELDASNLAANIFIGNYYYLMAEQQKRQLEQDYKKIATPTRMQYARYRDGLSRVLGAGYTKAKECLQNVVKQFPSTEAQKTLEKIRLVEKELNR